MTGLGIQDIKLVDATDEDAIERVRAMMHADDVWRNLARMEPPKRGKFHLFFANGKYQAQLITLRDSGEEIGFVLYDCGHLKSRSVAEIDIGIPDRTHRKLGASKLALAAAFDCWLVEEERCQILWGWIDTSNEASLRMVRAVGVVETARNEKDGIMVHGNVDTVEVAMTKERWLEVRPKLLALLKDG